MSEQQLIIELIDRWLKDQSQLIKSIDKDAQSFHKAVKQLTDLELHKLTRAERFTGAELPLSIAIEMLKQLARADESLAYAIGTQNISLSLCLQNLEKAQNIHGMVTVVECSNLDDFFCIEHTKAYSKKAITQVPMLSISDYCLFYDQHQAFLLKLKGNDAYIIREEQVQDMGLRAISRHQLNITQACDIIAFEIKNYPQIQQSQRLLSLIIAYCSADQSNRLSLSYSKERIQFSQSLQQFQAIQWMIADNFTELRAMELSIQHALMAFLKGDFSEYQLSQCEIIVSEYAFQICDRSLQIHGGYGYTVEYGVEKHWRAVQSCLSYFSKWERINQFADLV